MKEKTHKAFKALTRDELIAEFDKEFINVALYPQLILNELAHRDQQLQFEQMHNLTRKVTCLTWFIAFCTVAQVICAVISITK